MRACFLSCVALAAAIGLPGALHGQLDSRHPTPVLDPDHASILPHHSETAASRLWAAPVSVGYQQVTGQEGSRWLPGAILGFAVGTGVAYAVWHNLWYTYGCDGGANQDADYSEADCFGLALLSGGLPGALLGGLIGHQIKTSRFEAVPRLGLVPYDGRVTAGMTLSF